MHRFVQVADHFEWRYLVAMDLALANTYVGDSRYSQDVMGQIMDQVMLAQHMGLKDHTICVVYPHSSWLA